MSAGGPDPRSARRGLAKAPQPAPTSTLAGICAGFARDAGAGPEAASGQRRCEGQAIRGDLDGRPQEKRREAHEGSALVAWAETSRALEGAGTRATPGTEGDRLFEKRWPARRRKSHGMEPGAGSRRRTTIAGAAEKTTGGSAAGTGKRVASKAAGRGNGRRDGRDPSRPSLPISVRGRQSAIAAKPPRGMRGGRARRGRGPGRGAAARPSPADPGGRQDTLASESTANRSA